MPELQRLRADHASAVLEFERANRGHSAASISDRGDEFFEGFVEQFQTLLTAQQAGVGAYHVLVADNGSLLGRFNLLFDEDHSAELGIGSLSMRADEVWPPRRFGSSANWRQQTTGFAR